MKVMLNGTSIFVGTGGVDWVEDQPCLLLMHGAGMNRTVWVLLARYFARHGYNLIVPDLPGHGESAGTALTSIEAQAEHTWALVDTLKASHGLPDTPLSVGGHSMGALAALEFVGGRTDALASLILFGVGYPMVVGQPLLDAARANSHDAIDMISIYSHTLASQLGHNKIAGISVMNTAMALLEQAAPDVLFTDLNACNTYQGGENAAARIHAADVSVTIIAGDGDRMTPRKTTQKLASILKVDVDTIADSGHMMLSEQPESTLQIVRRELLAR